MMKFNIAVDPPQDLSRRKYREAMKKAWKRLGEFWHERILPKHFRMTATAEYKYQKRDEGQSVQLKDGTFKFRPGYVQRKERKFGHRLPLVYTGNMRAQAMHIRDVRPTGGSGTGSVGRVKIVLHGPRYLWAYRKDYGQPDKAAELRAISDRDADMLAKKMNEFATAAVREAMRSKKGKR